MARTAGRYIEDYCRYLGISAEKFWEVVESHRDEAIWELGAGNEWTLRESPGAHA